jgi:hypothetical protein
MDETLGHIGLPPKKEPKVREEPDNEPEDLDNDPRSWRPSEDGYIGAIDRGNGWEPAVILQDLSMDDGPGEFFEYLEIGGD